MPLPAPKKRKLSHTAADNDNDDQWSGFSSDYDDQEQQEIAPGNRNHESDTGSGNVSRKNAHEQDETASPFESTEDDASSENSEDSIELEDAHIKENLDGRNKEAVVKNNEESSVLHDKSINGSSYMPSKANGSAQNGARLPNRTSTKPAKYSNSGLYLAGNPSSNILKLQIDELLDNSRSGYGKKDAAAESTLRSLKTSIENIPDRDPLPILEAEEMMKLHNVMVPFPDPRPSKDAPYKLQYAKPAAINVVGSYALKTRSTLDRVVIDMVVVMPSLLFQEKDYLDYRYYYRRAYYLASLAAGLQKASKDNLLLKFRYFHGNSLLPILVAEPRSEDDAEDASGAKYTIQIIPSAPESLFPMNKTMPDKKSLRNSNDSTPFYNASIRSDTAILPYLKLIHAVSAKSDHFKDACLLGRIWLRQRGFGSSITAGGFGNFEWTLTMALLLQDNLPRGITRLSHGFDSFQMFKATLQFLASRDLMKQPIWYQCPDGAKLPRNSSPLFFDGVRGINILYKMSASSYKAFRHEARTSIKMFGDAKHDPFEAAFILKSNIPPLRYDAIIQLSSGTHELEQIYSTLTAGLGDRVSLVHVGLSSQADNALSWAPKSPAPKSHTNSHTQIGLVFNSVNVNRLIDHGPSAEDPDGSAKFRQFWGDKAELRRFKDGSVRESLLWSGKDHSSVPEQIVNYVLDRHFGPEIVEGMTFSGTQFGQMLLGGEQQGMSSFQGVMAASETLQRDIRELDGLPLEIRQIMATDSQLRYSSIDPPLYGSTKQMSTPANMSIQFEGSGRWPDDLEAIQRVKIAFLLKLSSLLRTSNSTINTRLGLENNQQIYLNRSFLDVTYPTGFSFRLRIHHDREQHLLETQLKSTNLLPKDKESLSHALASYKRTFLRLPAHTQAIQTACSRFPALSPTIRLVKKWFAAHLLSPHISAPLIELLTTRTFLTPWPWDVPASAQTGFLRTLFFLARWDWRHEPLIVDFAGAMTAEERGKIATRFAAWRQIDPALQRVVLFAASDVGPDGTEWSEFRPQKVVAGRMTGLAKAAMEVVVKEGERVALDAERLFVSSLREYDFVVWVKEEFTRAGRRRREKVEGGRFKNLQLQRKVDPDAVGFDPVGAFLRELEQVYGDAVVFFYDGYKGNVIAGLWSPHTARRRWKIRCDHSTVPVGGNGEDIGDVELNKEGILNEIASLGGDMIERIET